MKQWVFTINEVFDYVNENFKHYTIFIKGALYEICDGVYVCGTTVVSSDKVYDRDLRARLKLLYENDKFLITAIDIDDETINFNLIKES